MSEAGVRTQMRYWAMLDTLRPASIELDRVELVRGADPDALRDPAAVAALVTALGLNAEGVGEFPEHLRAHFGGLRVWQYPIQFGPYLHRLGELGVRSYLELGVRHGGSFVATVEYLHALGDLRRAVAVDIIRAPELDRYAASAPVELECAWVDSRGPRFATLLAERGPFDLAFVDSHHEEEQCRLEVARLAPHARMLALHDVDNVGCPGVAAVWAELEGSPEWACERFTAQYPGLGPFMGIGLAIKREPA